ncbi:PLP-dependent transferase [Paraburkholderia atlantica]|uniref:PLP-dependent transferase n=1 Tax=Paraburkholderia atlantica TaxID=2654982 RepID=UPI0017F0CC55|nr:PLP-dependent transferase [Paraburkholderia atlantica]MBB5510693.1 O-acetylhomoserine/O-acetylserine sulfhydrylase-like pyridoxal-dependent enzyme [Paraburkholderia atlantica]
MKLDDFGASPYLLKSRMTWLRDTGAAISPLATFQLIQGVETLHLRMQRHCENAVAVAEFLNVHSRVACVSYPSLSSGYERELVGELVDARVGYGAMIMFELGGLRRSCTGSITAIIRWLHYADP